ncbi:SMI1/KNR4 family protein, partial [Streptomyces sp. NPDC057193]
MDVRHGQRREPLSAALADGAARLALPQDYKDLIDTYGGGVFDETIWILEPDCADQDYDLVAVAAEQAEVLENLWGGGEPKPAELAADGTNVLPFAYIEGTGAYLYW